MEIAKSNAPEGWGRVRLSATRELCGWCRLAIATRFGDLGWDEDEPFASTGSSARSKRKGDPTSRAERGSPIGCDDEDVRVDRQILSVAAADIDANGSVGEAGQKALH